MPDRWTRRRLLVASAGLATLAGCTSTDDGDVDDAEAMDDSGTDQMATQSEDADGTTDGGSTENGTDDSESSADSDDTDDEADLDLREANVVGVDVESTGEAEYEFSVTLHHDDDGEDGYADLWRVETRDGEVLGQRELLHAHSTDPFTRSTTVEVPAETDCVVVRGRDQTHDYGGQAMLVSLPDGATEARRQGSEREEFDGVACP